MRFDRREGGDIDLSILSTDSAIMDKLPFRLAWYRILGLLVLLTASGATATAQHTHPHGHSHAADRVIEFPDVPGYQTLVVDLHTHSVFSDGSVWPNIRVQEAVRDGLDAVAITEHLEYQPHAADIPHPDRNRAYIVASQAAEGEDLIVIPGSEITRGMPPGHANAVFIQDATALLQDDEKAVFREAAGQGAFIFWNHPMWTAQERTGIPRLYDLHEELLQENLIHGIEVANNHYYSDEALQLALDRDLAIIGTSDIHGLVDWEYEVAEGGHRPVTLVFAHERSADAIKEALFARRTAIWFNDLLIGRERELVPLVESSLSVVSAAYPEDVDVMMVTVRNESDAPFIIRNESAYTLENHAAVLTLPPHEETVLAVRTQERVEELALPLRSRGHRDSVRASSRAGRSGASPRRCRTRPPSSGRSWAAWSTHCRCCRFPARYCLRVFVWKYSEYLRTTSPASSRLSMVVDEKMPGPVE